VRHLSAIGCQADGIIGNEDDLVKAVSSETRTHDYANVVLATARQRGSRLARGLRADPVHRLRRRLGRRLAVFPPGPDAPHPALTLRAPSRGPPLPGERGARFGTGARRPAVLGSHQEHLLSSRRGVRMAEITVTVDGVKYADHVEPRMLLVHYLREVVGKIGTPIGCDTSNCGACTVLMDGQSVKSCAVLAVQADGAQITTIEGLANGGLHPLQRAFHEEHALQCGYCTPGMIMAASDLLRENPHPTDTEIRVGLEGNLCRCTGYENIVRAVRRAAEAGVSQ